MFYQTRKIFLLLALTFAVRAFNTLDNKNLEATLEEVHNPVVGGVDRLCSISNTVNGTCTISKQLIRLTYDFYYTTNLTLVFDASILRCMTVDYLPCNVWFSMTGSAGMVLKNGSQFLGKQVLIDAPQTIVSLQDTSSISASGMSYNLNGTQGSLGKSYGGASFVGTGGSCPDTGSKSTYGNFNMLPDFKNLGAFGFQMGSIGNYGDAESGGGGRIVINADSLIISASGAAIQANAMPFVNSATIDYSLTGGSGGYIYINTKNVRADNIISPNFTVEAQGGFGLGGQYGGSGGVIVFDGGFSVNETQVTTAGGAALKATNNTNGCGNGGAGTVWYRKLDRLYVDNEGKQTIKPTMLTPPPNQVTDGSAPQKIASSILIQGSANVQFKNVSSWLLIDEFVMNDNVTVGYQSPLSSMTLQIGLNTQVSQNSLFDLSTVSIFSMNTSANTSVNIGNVNYGRILKIFGGNVDIWGTIKLANPANATNMNNSYFVIDSNTINVNQRASIQSAYILLQADGMVTLNGNSKITSYIENSCNNVSPDSTLFSCVAFKSVQTTITEQTFLSEYNKKFGTNATVFQNTFHNLFQNYSIYIVSFYKIAMINTVLQGPRIGLCAQNITLLQTTLNTSAQGCPSGQGIGKGQANALCAGSGGAYGGEGGYGSAYNPLNQSLCMSHAPKPYFYEKEARYEGSGGASGIKDQPLGGNGGGIIWISSTGTLALYQSKLLAQGQDGVAGLNGKFGSGGGSGGSIQIITKNIAGDGTISLTGGAGSVGGGGGGAGGRLVTSFLQGFNASNAMEQSLRWGGTLALQGGPGGMIGQVLNPSNQQTNSTNQTMPPVPVIIIPTNKTLVLSTLQQGIPQRAGDGQSGTSLNTKCFGGYSGPFCKPCEIGTFKYDFGFGVCQPCTNKPTNSYYNKTAQFNNQCAYQCSEGLEDVSGNPDCVDSMDLQIQRAGGTVASLIIFFCFFGLTLTIWIIIGQRSKCIRKEHTNSYLSIYNGIMVESANDQQENDTVIEKGSLHMRDKDIWAHTHRMYLIGENSISFPWYIPKDFPNSALNEINKDRFLYFIKKEQWTLDWTTVQKQIYYFFRTIFPYMSDFMHRAIRRQHFRNLQNQLFTTFDESHWEDRTGRSLRLTCDQTNSQLAYIDFIDYQKKKKDYVGPTLPMTLMLAGNGTLSTPYSVNFLEDGLAKSLVYLNKELLSYKLPEFFENLNTLLDKLCFYKFNRQSMKDLSDVIEWIELGNRTLFNPVDTKMTLYLFENSYQEVEGGSFKQRRRSMPLESMTFEAFPSLYKNLIRFVQMKLLTKKSEIRFGLVVKATSMDQRKRMTDRIRKLIQSSEKAGDRIQDFKNSSVSMLYNSDDEDEQDFHNKPLRTLSSGSLGDKNGPLKNLNRQNELSQGLLSESKMEISEIMVHGQNYETQIKIVDKSKRAFDISVESTRALELALQKEQKTCNNAFTRFKSVIYSIWLLLLKNHGKPPGAGSLQKWFVAYSLTFSLDILLTLVFLVHIANPLKNVWTFGFPFLFILPAITLIAPAWGLLAVMLGSSTMMKSYSNMNSSMVAINYPLTIMVMVYLKGPAFYIFVVILLALNKVLVSFFGAKVRQHFANPGYSKNAQRMDEIMRNINSATSQVFTGGLSAAERAAALVQSGRPDVMRSQGGGSDQEDVEIVDDDEAEDSFGIVSTKQLRNSQPVTNPNSDDEEEPRKTSEAFTRDTEN